MRLTISLEVSWGMGPGVDVESPVGRGIRLLPTLLRVSLIAPGFPDESQGPAPWPLDPDFHRENRVWGVSSPPERGVGERREPGPAASPHLSPSWPQGGEEDTRLPASRAGGECPVSPWMSVVLPEALLAVRHQAQAQAAQSNEAFGILLVIDLVFLECDVGERIE